MATHAVLGSASLSQVSAEYGTAGLPPPAQYSPALHALQVTPPLYALGADPAAQEIAVHDSWFGLVEKVPSGQAAHCRLAVADGATAT